MANSTFKIPSAVLDAFGAFSVDKSFLALPIVLINDSLRALPPVPAGQVEVSLQSALNDLDAVLDHRTPTYLVLRRNNSLAAITYVPYIANADHRAYFLEHRHELVEQLGKGHFAKSLICKEKGEITDARAWQERDDSERTNVVSDHAKDGEECKAGCEGCEVKDAGYKQTKCRLCDRRMKNKIAPEALEALKTLTTPGNVVQIHVDIATETLTLDLIQQNILPLTISSLIPSNSPTFTIYHHPEHALLYFIYHSPDSASVQQRMKHTMAIPGLLVHAEDVGGQVDRKIEIHDPEDLLFEAKDDRVGRFRSMYARKGVYNGTEMQYEGMERDKAFADSVR